MIVLHQQDGPVEATSTLHQKHKEQRKTNSELVETIKTAKKNKAWLSIGGILAGPRKNWSNLNLNKINKDAEDKKIIVVPGKVLSQGEIDKARRRHRNPLDLLGELN